jgi:hypothetical protein
MIRGLKRGHILFFVVIIFVLFNIYTFKAVVTEAVQGVERLRLQRFTAGYLTEESSNFRIRYAPGDVDVVPRVVAQAERQLDLVSQYFGYYPGSKITLIIYPNRNELETGLRLSADRTTLGAFYAGTISIISPAIWGDEGDQAEEGLYIHELTHLIMEDIAGGNYPVWFTEGMALYQEYLNTGFEWGSEYIFENNPYSIEELSRGFSGLDQVLAYKQSFLLVKAMMEKSTKQDVLKLFDRLNKGVSFPRAFEETLGYSLEHLESIVCPVLSAQD